MEKMRMESINLTEQNIDKIGAMFPNVITEARDENGNMKRAVNFSLLKQILSDDVVDGDEAYEFTWVGKKTSIMEAGKTIRKTLRPYKEESKDWDTTGNLYIEGDNLDALKLLQESYLGAVKMIYIDPPYNTGNDFIYRDKFKASIDEFDEAAGVYDENDNRLFLNSESNGRFHSDWCSMMYSRLQLARNLLSEDGVMFISIDDNEVENLKKICNEIFGEDNATVPLLWLLPRGINAGLVARAHEYILCYAKNINEIRSFKRLSNELEYSIERCNKKVDSRHPMSTIDFPAGIRYEGTDKVITGTIEGSERIEIVGDMIFKNGKLDKPVTLNAGWTMRNLITSWISGNEVCDSKGQKINEFFFKDNGKLYSKKEINTLSIKSVLKDIPDTQKARKEMEELFGSQDIFPYPKTKELIRNLVKLSTNSDSIILDFFSGSGTTGHAVMQTNAEDNGKRKFIMVQLNEDCPSDSEAFNSGYSNICEIGKERIRRAGEKIKEDSGLIAQDLDIGFRVLKLDSTNMKDVYYSADEYSQGMLSGLESNIKEDRTDMDLLLGCLIEWGLPLSLPHASEEIDGVLVHTINDGDLIACFAQNISEVVVTEIAKRQPLRAVFRDNSFANSPEKINVEEIFKLMAPNTSVKVL